MTKLSLSELASAEVVPNQGGLNGFLVRVSEGEYEAVNKSGKNTLLLRKGVDLQDSVEYGGILVDYDLENDDIYLVNDNGDEVRVPSEKQENVLWSVYDEDGPRLNKLFESLYVPTVRHGLMDMLMPRFRGAETDIQKTDDGWLIDGEILVGWDARNSPVNVDETHVVRAGGTIPADTEKEAREITFDLPEERTAALPNGTRTNLDDVEMRFLTSVALIVGTPQTGLYNDGLADAIRDSTIKGFTDTKSGLHHGHGLGKHTLSQLGVTEEAHERLWYNSYDHTGVHELAVRENEFRDAPIDVFDDAPNDDTSKWNKIHSTKQKAPIPKRVRADLEDRYGE